MNAESYMPASDDLIAESHIDLEERIRRRAHEIYLARDGQPGSELEDWLRAEREVLGESQQPAQDRGTTVGSAGMPDQVFSEIS